MFEKILVPTDFSAHSQKVIECIAQMPGVKDVILLHVFGPTDPLLRLWDPETKVAESRSLLSGQKMLLEGRNLSVKERIEALSTGRIWSTIQQVADEEKVSVVFMGARGKGLVEGIVLGSVAKDVLRYGHTNLLLMRNTSPKDQEKMVLDRFCNKPFRKVLFAMDFSVSVNDVVSHLNAWGGPGEVLLQHVVFSGETWKEVELKTSEASAKLGRIQDELKSFRIKSSFHVSVGRPAEEINALAIAEDVSMIVMGAYGKGWWKQLTLGSTTYDVASTTYLPLLVLRFRKE